MELLKNPYLLLALKLLVAGWILKKVYVKTSAWLAYKASVRRHGCQEPPRYPHKEPFLGLDLFMLYMKAFGEKDFLKLNQRMFATYGKTFKVNILGATVIKTMDPEITKCVHATQFDYFGVENIRASPVKNLWGDGITMVDGEKWANRRALIKPSFDVVHISNINNRSLGEHVKRLMDLLPRDGSTVDLMELFKRLSLDTASEFIFGKSMDALSAPDAQKDFLENYFYAQRGTAIRLMLGKRFVFLHRDKKWWDSCEMVNKFLDERVDEALVRLEEGEVSPLEGGKGRLRLIDEMAKATQNRLTLRFQLQNVFTPAHDGAAVTLSNAFFHLSRHPDVYAKLRAEILPTKDLPITYELLNSYQYLKRVYRETQRVTPISTMIQRQCIKSVVLPSGGGKDGKAPFYVQEGDIIEMNFRCTERDKDFWGEDAEEFRPERWEIVRPTWEYTPFGGGPRVCPAMRLVFTEVAYTMVTILREFERIESRDDREWTEEMRTTFQNANGAKVALIPAKAS
ncbi:cytochrome P450 [Zopfia rhizophila CBS 207.26]|uniref:Cytochrome P450 n=1 Tax=Zopfia rhizophila CBS 207.26 TaxID=1314779 RepID=A0A6A6EGU7_9PEZI|nr:cytochrome P450 [Zopfia rhizophila CBS 207.26]